MPEPPRMDHRTLAMRVARELVPGQVVALGSGLPSEVLPVIPADSTVQFLTESGLLGRVDPVSQSAASRGLVDSNGCSVSLASGGSVSSLVDVAAMLRGGHLDLAVLQPAQVDARGSFSHWTSADASGLAAPGLGVDLAFGARRVIAMMPHTRSDGSPSVVSKCTLPVDGLACVNLIVTDVAVMAVTESELLLMEVAPGWTAEDVAALTGAPLSISTDLREMTFDPPQAQVFEKVYSSGLAALDDVPDGAVVMIDGFAGPGGTPHYLLTSLRDHGAKELTIISNTAGIARVVNFGTPPGKQAIDHTILIDNQQVKKAIASYPVSPSASRPTAFELAYRRGEVELELVPQGTLAERLRAGGAGVAAFYTPTGVGTLISEGKETRVINGKEYILEEALRADYCIIRGHQADTLGNVVYKGTSRNFNSVMAPSARITIVEVDEVVEPGQLGPEEIVTPGIYVDRIVVRPRDFSPYE